MRRSGSSSCILRPKHSLSAEDLQRLATDAPTTTVLTVTRLPSYCTDRLYMLSELQVHANSIHFLCDVPPCSASGGNGDGDSADNLPSLPPSIILYLLWKPNTYPTPRSFADGPVSECVRQCLLANGDEAPGEELEAVRSSPRSSTYSPRRQQQNLEQRLSPQAREQLKEKSSVLGVLESKEGSVGSDSWRSSDRNGSSDSIRISRRKRKEDEKQQLTRIYVVVDRISPSETDDSLNGIGEMPSFPDLASCSSVEDTQSRSQNGEIPAAPVEPSQSRSKQQQSQSPTKEQREQQQLAHHNSEINIAEKLARAVSSSGFLRDRIDGISIGITSDARAAPGLEACMDAVARGAKERRQAVRNRSVRRDARNRGSFGVGFYGEGGDERMNSFRRREKSLDFLRDRSPERSPVAIVAVQPDDLEGMDHHDHSHHHHDHSDHAERILQCRVSTEWNGKGECNTFTDRAMKDWRQAWCLGGGEYGAGEERSKNMTGGRHSCTRPKVPRISARGTDEAEYDEIDVDEPISTVMVTVFLAAMAAYVWSAYGDMILAFLFGDMLRDAKP